jgi:drug/metabolite transporter (DMT)-like permease
MTRLHRDNRRLAMLCVLGGVGLASAQDAVVKFMSTEGYPAYETLLFRCIGTIPVMMFFMWQSGRGWNIGSSLWKRILLRGLILGIAYLGFVLSLPAMPIASAVAIYFTMPFFVAGFAGPILGERVRIHRWLAISVGFIGVLIIVRPGSAAFQPAALLALISAMGYAFGQMIGRPISQVTPPIIIAVWQNFIYAAIAGALLMLFNVLIEPRFTHPSLVFLSRPWVWPTIPHLFLLFGHGMLAAFAMLLFVNAYKYAEANFVAPFEYSSMIWAVIWGLALFTEFPDAYTWIGGAIVVAAGIAMIFRDRQLDRAIA